LHNKVTYLCGLFDCEREAAKSRDMKIISLNLSKPLQILKEHNEHSKTSDKK
jgi:hypothetical protein